MTTPASSRLIWFPTLAPGDASSPGIYIDPFFVESVRDRPDVGIVDAATIAMQSGATHLVHDTPQKVAERINLAREKADARIEYSLASDLPLMRIKFDGKDAARRKTRVRTESKRLRANARKKRR